jgi:hypothetical protein
MRTGHPSNTTGTRRNGDLWIVIALATLLGLPVMLLTFAIGVGDTSIRNSSGPWVAGYVIGLGIPLAVGVGSYVAVRRRGAHALKPSSPRLLLPPQCSSCLLSS